MSQREFGNRIGYAEQSVLRWEGGLAKPRERALRAIIHEFGVPIEIFQVGDSAEEIDTGTAFDAGLRTGLRRAASRIRDVLEDLEPGAGDVDEPRPAPYERHGVDDDADDQQVVNGP